STDTDWCSVSLDDFGNMTLVAKANKTGKKRSGTVTVTGSTYDYDTGKEYTSKATLRIEQWEEQEKLLSGSPDKFELKSNAQDKTLTITTNLPYFEVPYDEEYDWINPVRTGSGNTYTIHFDENGGLDKRKGTITIKGWFDQRLAPAMITSIPVTQESASLGEISVTPDSLIFKAEGGLEDITFYTAGYPYYGRDVADDAKDWLTVQFGAGYEYESDKLVSIGVSKNTTSVARIGIVTFWVSDVENPTESQKKKVTFTVKQEAAAVPTIKVDPDHLDFEASGGTQTLTVTTNQPYWGGSKKGSWFTVTTNGNKITVTADPNPNSDPREGSMTLYARNENKENVSEPVVIPIKQKGATSAAAIYKWVKFVYVEFKGTVHTKSNDHAPEDWIDTWSSRIPSSISRQHMEENGLKVDVSDSGSLVKITKTLEFDRYDNNHWIYKAEIYIDPVKKLITSLYVYEKFWITTNNGDQPQVLTLRAENIPLEKEKSGTGTKAKGTILNELSHNGQSGWVVFDRKWEGADDYQIKVTLSE
ncbi:MAG: BACON domain-containing protein, partial [Prevotella sp.]|nr:BACON domain-containing protein [Prevotella sp.]